MTSRLGRVLTAVRDAELKTRFCGYDSTHYKLFVWTLSAMLCGLAGALYVPQVGIINPSEMQPSNSIEMAIWVAVGGRGTLVGAVLGAWIVNGGKSWLTDTIPVGLAVRARRAVRRRDAVSSRAASSASFPSCGSPSPPCSGAEVWRAEQPA